MEWDYKNQTRIESRILKASNSFTCICFYDSTICQKNILLILFKKDLSKIFVFWFEGKCCLKRSETTKKQNMHKDYGIENF